MLDDFFARALVAGVGVALVAGPLGCFIVWRRMAYFGDTLAHSALLGVAIALALDTEVAVAVFGVCTIVALALRALQAKTALASDAILGLLSHAVLALGLVAIAFMAWVRVDLAALLFGDILSVSRRQIAVIYLGGALVLGVLAWIWRPLFAATVNRELAAAEGQAPERTEIVFMLLLALVIAMAMKIVGILLITALLIMPAATARRLSTGPEQMAWLAAAVGVLAALAGLAGSLHWDTPSGPSIVVAALVLFIISLTRLPRRAPGNDTHRQGTHRQGTNR